MRISSLSGPRIRSAILAMAESRPKPASTLTVSRSRKSGSARAISCRRVLDGRIEDEIGQVVREQDHENGQYDEPDERKDLECRQSHQNHQPEGQR